MSMCIKHLRIKIQNKEENPGRIINNWGKETFPRYAVKARKSQSLKA